MYKPLVTDQTRRSVASLRSWSDLKVRVRVSSEFKISIRVRVRVTISLR